MDQRDALGLGGDHIIIRRSQLQQFLCRRRGQFRVAKDDEGSDIQVIRHAAQGQVTIQSGNVHGVVHSKILLVDSIDRFNQKTGTRCRKL